MQLLSTYILCVDSNKCVVYKGAVKVSRLYIWWSCLPVCEWYLVPYCTFCLTTNPMHSLFNIAYKWAMRLNERTLCACDAILNKCLVTKLQITTLKEVIRSAWSMRWNLINEIHTSKKTWQWTSLDRQKLKRKAICGNNGGRKLRIGFFRQEKTTFYTILNDIRCVENRLTHFNGHYSTYQCSCYEMIIMCVFESITWFV